MSKVIIASELSSSGDGPVLRLKVADKIVKNARAFAELQRRLLAAFPSAFRVDDWSRESDFQLYLYFKVVNAELRKLNHAAVDKAVAALKDSRVSVHQATQPLVMLVTLSHPASYLDVRVAERLKDVAGVEIASEKVYRGKLLKLFVPQADGNFNREVVAALRFDSF